MPDPEQGLPADPRALRAQAALADALALTTAAAWGPADGAATLIISEYLLGSSPASLPLPRPARAQGSLVELLVACAFLAQLLRAVADAPLEAADPVWAELEELEDYLEEFVTGNAALPVGGDTLPKDLDDELHALLTGAAELLPRAPRDTTPRDTPPASWAAAVWRLNLPVTTPATTFALLQAGYGIPGCEDIAAAVERCVRLCTQEPSVLVAAASFQVLLATSTLRDLAEVCAQAGGQRGEDLLVELGAVLARRRGFGEHR